MTSSPDQPENRVVATDVRKSFGPLEVLKGVSFTCAALVACFALSPNIYLTVLANIALTSVLAVLLPGLFATLSLAIPARARSVGFSVASWWAIPGLALLPAIGWVGDRLGIRAGMMLMVPVLVVGGAMVATGGKVIREIVEKTGAKINNEDDGTIKIASSDGKQIEAAIKWIKGITDEAEVGAIYQGTVVKTADFGAFVNFFGSKDGLVHISQLAEQRVNKTTDVVKEGDKVWVKLLGFDERGKVRLSMKVVDQETGKEKAAEKPAEPAAE